MSPSPWDKLAAANKAEADNEDAARQAMRDAMMVELRRLKAEGVLAFSDCLEVFEDTGTDAQVYADAVPADDHLELAERIVLSQADKGAWVLTWSWVANRDVWQGAVDSDGEPCRYLNKYHCEACDESWEDTWSCGCNDECPLCGREIEPEESIELNLKGEPNGPDEEGAD